MRAFEEAKDQLKSLRDSLNSDEYKKHVEARRDYIVDRRKIEIETAEKMIAALEEERKH